MSKDYVNSAKMTQKLKLKTTGDSHPIFGLGVSCDTEKVYLYYYSHEDYKTVNIAQSEDGIDFEKANSTLDLEETNLTCISLTKLKNKDLVSYGKNTENGMKTYLGNHEVPGNISCGLSVPDYKWEDKDVFYFGGEKIILARFKTPSTLIVKNIKDDFPDGVDVDLVMKTSQGIFLIYNTYGTDPEVKIMCLSLDDPRKVVWETQNSIWEKPSEWEGKEIKCLGCVFFKGKLITYWRVEGLGVYLVTHPVFQLKPAHDSHHYKLDKHVKNPILAPKDGNTWENEAVFNPAAFYDNGKVYLIYRAVGHEYISVLGYAESTDGIHFDKRLEYPIYTGTEWFDKRDKRSTEQSVKRFMSGGGYGGCEDPRITKIGDRLHMIYVAFNGWEGPRLAATSIKYEDFLNHRFLWEKPVLISPPGVIDKSGCLLPEKINGKYVIFHRIYPDILIDFVDDLDFDGTNFLKGEFKISPRKTMWDSRKIGAGAPPIKTDAGWLMIYQAVTDKDASKYKVGAMLLDLNDPTKVIARSAHPIIEPTEHYENGLAKFGVVYPCGAVIVGDKLMVYYGGSDSVCCLATAPLKEFLHELINGNGGTLQEVKLS